MLDLNHKAIITTIGGSFWKASAETISYKFPEVKSVAVCSHDELKQFEIKA